MNRILYLDIINMIGCEGMSNEYKDEVLRKLSVYCNNFSEEQLAEYEDEIFTERIDKKKRAELEFARLRVELGKNLKIYSDYYSELREIARLLKVADLSSDILDDIYRRIVKLQLSANLDIRLYSAFSLIKAEEEIKQLRKKAGEAHNGTKFNR